MLNEENIRNALIFLNRVDLKGNEAMPMTDLQIKLQSMRAQMQEEAGKQAQPPEPPPADPPAGGKKEGEGAPTEH